MNIEAGIYKTLTYLGLVLLLGGAFFRRGVGPRMSVPLGALGLGALLILAGSLLEPAAALRALLGSFSAGDYLDYLQGSTQGQAALLRLALTAALLAVELQGWRSPLPSALLGLALLAAVGSTSHGHALGNFTYALDIAHLAAMVAWAGAVFYFAWQPRASGQSGEGAAPSVVQPTVRRVSATGLWSVVVLAATGTLAALCHIPGVGALSGTPYGLLLVFKLAVFALILLLAARNRFVLLRPDRLKLLRSAVRAESVLLLGVLALSGLLTSSAPPDIPKKPAATPIQLQFGAASVSGQIRTNETGGVKADLAVSGTSAKPDVTLVMTDHPMPPVHLDLSGQGGHLTGQGQLWMTGTWFADVRLGGQTRRVPLQTR